MMHFLISSPVNPLIAPGRVEIRWPKWIGNMLRVTDTHVVDGMLTITCEGVFGIGSLGNPSGHPVKDCIRAALERETLSRILIDFRGVDYEWGDAPAWSILDALKHRIPVTYLCSTQNVQALEGLFAASGLRALAEIRVLAEPWVITDEHDLFPPADSRSRY